MYTTNYITKILEYVKGKNATDIHITAGSAPAMRIDGQLTYMQFDIIRPEDIANIIHEILNEEQKKILKANHYISLPIVMKNTGRLRANIFMQRSSFAINIKLLDRLLKEPEELGIPEVVIDLHKQKSGLILICGNKNSGKTTTMAAIIRKISTSRECHIITIEDPIEYLYKHDMAIVNQKEVGIDVNSFQEGVYSAMNQDADVIMTSFARDPEIFSSILSAAENGHLVITTLQTIDSISTIEYITGMFPADRRNHIKILLSNVLQAIVSQRLIPGKSDNSSKLAVEVMLANQAMKNLILENKTHQIPAVIKSSKSLGMITMEDSIKELCYRDEIDRSWLNT